MAGQQQDHSPVIQGFRKWVDDNSVPGTLGDTERVNSRFMIAQRLETWLKDGTHARDLLRALFDDDAPPVQPQEIYGKCENSFAILLLIGKGKYIEHFVRHERLWDKHMPFDAKSCPTDFPTTDVDPGFFKKFVARQWQFFPHTFSPHDNDIQLEPERILPIISKDLLGTGGFADLYKITLHASYDHLTSRFDQSRDANSGFTNTYVLKTYRSRESQDAITHYRNEVAAFRRLSYRPGCIGVSVIGFYGSFTQETEEGSTFNVLLEYANGGTLEKFLDFHDPPTDAESIYKFWNAIFNLTNAIERIHAVPPNESGPPILRGWHQDIKPANILVTHTKAEKLNPYDVQFKLADLGLAHFRRIKSLPKEDKDADPDTRGTRIYGAPECYRFDDLDEDQPLDVKQSVDIWSLGCVFSEVAVWVVLGKGSLVRYRKNRQVATKDLRDQGCFHDGEEVLQCVVAMHDKAFSDIRESDHITRAVIKKMITEMLDNFEGRPNARQLRRKAHNILTEAEKIESKRKTELGQNGNWQSSSKESQHSSYHSKTRKMPQQLPPGVVPASILPDKTVQAPDTFTAPSLKKRSQTTQFDQRPPTPESSGRPSFDTSHGHPTSIIAPSLFEEIPIDSPIRQPDLPPSSTPESSSRVRTDVTPSSDSNFSTKPTKPANGGPKYIKSPSQSSNLGSSDLGTNLAIRSSPPAGDSIQVSRETDYLSTEGISQPNASVLSDIGAGQSDPAIAMNMSPKSTDQTEAKAKERPKLPTIFLRDLENWILKKKQRGLADAYLENKNEIMKELGLRDHIFLIDDAYTMKPFWNVDEGVVNFAKALAYIVKASDKDGMELYFTCSESGYNVDSATKMETKLRGKSLHGKSNMASSLGRILQDYEERLREERRENPRRKSLLFSMKSKELKPLNVYVFTDARWQPHCNVAEKIVSLVTTMKELRFHREQVGIQFIQFGDDPICTKKLQDLDDAVDVAILKEYDIVDTEPAAGGNCWKMLVGAINKWYDKNE